MGVAQRVWLCPVAVMRALRGFAGLARVTMENAGVVADALDWAEGGLDFADALHLATARGHAGFVSIDKGLVRAARRLNVVAREP